MDQGFRVESLGCNMQGSKHVSVFGFPSQVSDAYPELLTVLTNVTACRGPCLCTGNH